jgi:phosphomannomutase
MTLIKSISGIRGTIGGKPGEGLTPTDILKFTRAYSDFIRSRHSEGSIRVVIGRDARVSGDMVNRLVTGTLIACGIDVIDAGLSTTPTVEMAVVMTRAQGGIILTASHNPAEWNALKLLNDKGEFLSGDDGREILKYAENPSTHFPGVHELGKVSYDDIYIQRHIEKILELELVDPIAIKRAGIKVAYDAVNSTGGLALKPLLEQLGVSEIVPLYDEPTGLFPHNPEPLPENVTELCSLVKEQKADVGFVVDPDVDRLAIITEEGEMFGEEYTLVAVADYVLQHNTGPTVSNLSSTRALRDITLAKGQSYHASAVGEVNVVEKMKEVGAVIGGEGNGGVIYPQLHYGRDALAGVALFLSFMARSGKKVSEIKSTYPSYTMSKNKVQLTPQTDVDRILSSIAEAYAGQNVNRVDGVKIDFPEGWVHLRKSNTEPIIRVYTEGKDKTSADRMAGEVMHRISNM